MAVWLYGLFLRELGQLHVDAFEVLDFKGATVGKRSPIAWRMHNKGLFDEYRDVRIEENPKEDRLTTVE